MDHVAHLIGTHASEIGLVGALFVVGLAGSIGHCAAMCGPFVLAQLPTPSSKGGRAMLMRGALVPYHLGRATTYMLLGAAAGGLGSGLAQSLPQGWPMRGLFLMLGAALFLMHALKGLGLLPMTASDRGIAASAGAVLARLSRPLLLRCDRIAGYCLGVALGFLPCGLLYGALSAAAGSGGAITGALAMAAFTASTVPALVAIGCAGSGIARHWQGLARRVVAPLQAVNAAVLVVIAVGGAS